MHAQAKGDRAKGRTYPVQLTTGVSGLDRLLNGGIREGGLHVVLGGAGTGKSVLAHQIGAHMVRSGGKVLYLTSLVESHQTLLAQARTFDFFDPRIVPTSFYYASLYSILDESGLKGARAEISRLVAHHSPSLVVIDGVHALKVAAADRLDYQRFIHELEAQSAVTGVTTLLLAHPPEGGVASDPTFTIGDAIFHMRTRTVQLRQVRMFSVGKLRGVGHIGGWHTFVIGRTGIHIHPRAESLVAGATEHVVDSLPAADDESTVLGTDIAGLDEMLGGGLDRDSATLVVGTPGSGKTLSGLAFLTAGAAAGEPGLLLGYHEIPQALIDKGESAGWPSPPVWTRG